jgi:pimeloyl-ACP methyl ester carboxylesterase
MRQLLVAAMLMMGTTVASGQTPTPTDGRPSATVPTQRAAEAPERSDYSKAEHWLCRPGKANDACAVDLTTTVVAPSGATTRETFSANPNAAIDCFYVYPTVSSDASPNSDLSIDPAEQNVIRQQFARFGSQCRTFAPMYRQVTLAGLRAAMTGGGRLSLDQGPGYGDVLDAWNHYLKNDNKGRGVVLVGHSQGAMVLTRLIAEEIDGKPMQSRLVSAILMGTSVAVPKGKDVGGAFKNIPVCRAAGQVGCLISFVTFRSSIPPPANTLFGRVAGEGMEAACTNPAALAGGSGQLRAYLTGQGSLIASGAPQKHQWVKDGAAVETPFVSVPGLLSAECASNEHANFLKITVHADPNDPRADDIPGDLGMLGKPQPNWGLHLVDVNLTMGNLLDVVSQQAKAYLSKQP